MRIRFVVLLMLLPLWASLSAFAIEASAGHTVFYLPDEQNKSTQKPYIELYWQVNPRTLYFKKGKNDTLSAQIKTSVIFRNESGIISDDHFVLQTPNAFDKKGILDMNIMSLHRYFLPYGKVRIELQMWDAADSANHFSYMDSVEIGNQTTDVRVHYSGLQLLDTAFKSAAAGEFQKNDMAQVPFCANFYDTRREKLNYYFELYHTDILSQVQFPLVEYVYISKKQGDVAFSDFVNTDTIVDRNKPVHPVLGQLGIAKLQSGNYYLNVCLKNKQNITVAAQSLFFQRLNVKPKDSVAKVTMSDTAIEKVNVVNMHNTFLAKYTLPQILTILKMLVPVSDQAETQTINGFLSNPDDTYTRYYVYNYFLNQNPTDPAQAWKEYSDKVREVNREFKSAVGPGFSTERGAIFLRYGKPDERIVMQNEPGAYPYEVWQYNSLTTRVKRISNALFLFYKPSGAVADFILLHSNVPGEARNTNWRSYLYISGKSSGNNDARAEQYIGNN